MSTSAQQKKRVEAFLQIGARELEAARTLVNAFPEQGMFFLQQAAEKFARALHGDQETKERMIRCQYLGKRPKIMRRARDFALRFDQSLSAAATRYRYPTSAGRMLEIDADPLAAIRDVEAVKAAVSAYLQNSKML